MADFRQRTPSRRDDPSRQTDYKKYKPELRDDFHERCGYCGDHDYFRNTYYEIDHFVPRHHWKTIKENDYANLVYSCRSCNNAKRAKWPTKEELIHNNGKVGFVDPCNSDYANQFARGKDGSIIATTDLGKGMWSALNFGNPSHRITWTLEELRKSMNALIDLRSEGQVDTQINEGIALLAELYLDFEQQLRGIPHF